MRPAKTKIKKFRQETRYPHLRSEGLTRRGNRGTRQLTGDRPRESRHQPDDEDYTADRMSV